MKRTKRKQYERSSFLQPSMHISYASTLAPLSTPSKSSCFIDIIILVNIIKRKLFLLFLLFFLIHFLLQPPRAPRVDAVCIYERKIGKCI